jgi:membrane-bound lytic murein transglycosylase D
VAREYRVEPTSLAAANQLHGVDSIEGIAALVVPVPPSLATSAHTRLYTARKGDTLVTIADRFGVSLNQLRRWNKLTGTKVAAGTRIRVAEPVVAQRTSTAQRRKGSTAAKTQASGRATTSSKAPGATKSTASKPAMKKKSTRRK